VLVERAGELESVTVAVIVNVPTAVGVPLTAPAEDIDSPAGSPVALKERGEVPPDAVKVKPA
jgi:hypothetical protein